MLSVEIDAGFQFPGIENVVDLLTCSRKEFGGVCGGEEAFSQKTGAVKIQREALGLTFPRVEVQIDRNPQIVVCEPVALVILLTVNHHKLAVLILHLMAQGLFVVVPKDSGA